jgi:hypothetical protein
MAPRLRSNRLNSHQTQVQAQNHFRLKSLHLDRFLDYRLTARLHKSTTKLQANL